MCWGLWQKWSHSWLDVSPLKGCGHTPIVKGTRSMTICKYQELETFEQWVWTKTSRKDRLHEGASLMIRAAGVGTARTLVAAPWQP